MSHLFLVGFMGAGKSTVARLLASRLGRSCVDTDRLVEASAGRTIAEIFSECGEPEFRRLESAALSSLADAPPSVVACGGGIVTDDGNRAALKSMGRVVYLRVTPEEMFARVGGDPRRPLLAGGDALAAATALLGTREEWYAAVADLTVDTVDRSADAVANDIIDFLRSEGPS